MTSRDGGASVFGAGADRSTSLAPSGALVEPHPLGGSKMPRLISRFWPPIVLSTSDG
jgi:hypothetical protein